MPGGTDWKARYDKKFPGEFQIYSPFSYDATMVLADAMVRAKSADPKVYAKELPKTHYQGVTGMISFDKTGELQQPAITLYHYVDGKKEALN